MKDKLLFNTVARLGGDLGLQTSDYELMVMSEPLIRQVNKLFVEEKDANYAHMLESLNFPFEKTALEFPLLDANEAAPSTFVTHGGGRTVAQITPTRIGVFDSPDSYESGIPSSLDLAPIVTVAPATRTSDGALNFLYWRYFFVASDELIDLAVSQLSETYGAHNLRIIDSTHEVKVVAAPSNLWVSLVQLQSGKPIQEHYMYNNFPHAGEIGLTDEAMREGARVAWSAIWLLNFLIQYRSGVKRYAVTPKQTVKDKLNKGKSKRRGARRYTHVYLDKLEYIKNDAPVMRTDMQAHMVRGHFKRKKNGIFWWNPFVRGRGKLNKREAYIVKESADERSPMVVQQDQVVREVPEAVLPPQGGEGLHGAGNGGHAVRD